MVNAAIETAKMIVEIIVGALNATSPPPRDAKFLKNETISTISPQSGLLSVVVRLYRSVVTKQVHRFESSFSCQRGF
jgi:hypothetical protein